MRREYNASYEGELAMMGALTWLLVFQLAGEVIVQGFGLPVPGPAVGMLFLLIALVLRDGCPEALRYMAHVPLSLVARFVGARG